MAADVAVFDPDTVAPGPLRRVRDFPADGERLVADAPVGMIHVLVNGTPIRRDGAPVADALKRARGKCSGADRSGARAPPSAYRASGGSFPIRSYACARDVRTTSL